MEKVGQFVTHLLKEKYISSQENLFLAAASVIHEGIWGMLQNLLVPLKFKNTFRNQFAQF